MRIVHEEYGRKETSASYHHQGKNTGWQGKYTTQD